VQNVAETVIVLPDGAHMHPRVLGNARPAIYAGDLRIEGGEVRDVTNLSGTFQFDDALGLLAVAAAIELAGIKVQTGAVRFFPQDGSTPRILR